VAFPPHRIFIPPPISWLQKCRGVFLGRTIKKVVRKIKVLPSLKFFDNPWSVIICKMNIEVAYEFGVVGVRWGREISENRWDAPYVFI